MNCCGGAKQFYNRSCPAPVGNITVNQTIMQWGDERGNYVFDTVTVYGTTSDKVTVPNAMLDAFTPKVYINGVLQVKGVHYCILGNKRSIRFKFPLTGTDLVSVTYAYQKAEDEE